MVSLTQAEFYKACREFGFLNKEPEFAHYTAMNGVTFANAETGQPYHNGKFYVPQHQNKAFQELVVRALRGGVQLSISQLANEETADNKTPVCPTFFDVDLKDFLTRDASEQRWKEVSQAVFSIVQSMFEDQKWSDFMMDRWQPRRKKQATQQSNTRLPQFIKDRWPSFRTIRDILTAFRSNPYTVAEFPHDSTFTLAELFASNVDAQNWLGIIVAAGIAHHTQKVVREFYPSLKVESNVFDILAMSSINGTSQPSDKIGAHIHMMNLFTTRTQMIDIASAVENALIRLGGSIFSGTVDKAIYGPRNTNIRMPFTWKTEDIKKRGDQQQAKRPKMTGSENVSDDGKKVFVKKLYKCVARFASNQKGRVDLTSELGYYLCVAQDMLMTIMASQIRLDIKQSEPTLGFTSNNLKKSDIYTTTSIMPSLLGAGYTQKEAEDKQKILLDITDPEQQQRRLNNFLVEAVILKKKPRVSRRMKQDTDRFAYLPPDHKGFRAFEKHFPRILNLVFTKRETNGTFTNVYEGFKVGTVTVDKIHNTIAINEATGKNVACYNRKVGGIVPNAHNFGNEVTFVMDGNSTITQRCYNKNDKSANRAHGPCKNWSGHKVDIQKAMMSNLNPRSLDYEKQVRLVNASIHTTIPGMMEDALKDFIEPMAEPATVVQATLATQIAHDTAVAEAEAEEAEAEEEEEEEEEAVSTTKLSRTQSFTFGKASSCSSSPAVTPRRTTPSLSSFERLSRSNSPTLTPPTIRQMSSFTGGSGSMNSNSPTIFSQRSMPSFSFGSSTSKSPTVSKPSTMPKFTFGGGVPCSDAGKKKH